MRARKTIPVSQFKHEVGGYGYILSMHCSYVVYASAEDAQDCDHRPLLRLIVYILGIDSRQNRRWMELAIDVYTGDSL